MLSLVYHQYIIFVVVAKLAFLQVKQEIFSGNSVEFIWHILDFSIDLLV